MIEHILGIPTEQVLALPSVRLVGDCKAEISNHKGLVAVSDARVIVSTRAGNLVLEGMKLEIAHVEKEYLTVKGKVRRIYYEECV